MELLKWLTDNQLGEMVFTMLVSMLPVIELRGGVPFGTALGLPPGAALAAGVVGNLIPVPFIIVYIRRVSLAAAALSPAQHPGGPAGAQGPPEGEEGQQI